MYGCERHVTRMGKLKFLTNFGREPQRKKLHARPGRRRKGNIEMDRSGK
jgi:hypothetical protein